MKPEAEEMKALSPKLSPDFATKVLQAVDRKRRRRAFGASLVLVVLASVGLATAVRPRQHAAELSAADFAWLEDVGPSATSATALLFPDEMPSSGDDSPIDEATESL